MNKNMKKLLESSYKGEEIIVYIEALEKQRDTYAENYRWLIEKHNTEIKVLEKALDKVVESLIKMCNEYYECEKCPLYPCNTPCGFKEKFLKEVKDEI